MAGIKSFGIGVTVNTIAVGGLTDAALNGVSVSMIDVTAHDSTGGWKEFVGGLKDGGTIDLSGNFDESNAGQSELIDEQGESAAIVVTFSDNSTITATAIIDGFNVTGPLDDKLEFSCSAKVTGEPVLATPAA